MEDGNAPTILFLGSLEHSFDVARWAAEAGFRSYLSAWHHCDGRNHQIVAAEGHEFFSSGEHIALPGPTQLCPVLVGVLDRGPATLQRGRQLALSTSAFWAHHQLDKPHVSAAVALDPREIPDVVAPGWARPYCVAYGTLCYAPGERVLRVSGLYAAPVEEPGAANHHHPIDRLQQELDSLVAVYARDWTFTMDPLVHRIVAPLLIVADGNSIVACADPLCNPSILQGFSEQRELAIRHWLRDVRHRVAGPAAIVLPSGQERLGGKSPFEQENPELPIGNGLFPQLFGTDQEVYTGHVEDASFVYLDQRLQQIETPDVETTEATLHKMLCRRRTPPSDTSQPLERRQVEPGVGRACLVTGIRLQGLPEFHDFTVLGVGLTPFSEGGYVEIGRKIDGKASLIRAAHRRTCAERLEAASCRTGRVVAIAALPGDAIEMPDGSESPSALVIRAFRSAYRVKQLDPLICCLHSIQHTPLVSAYLADRARALRRRLSNQQPGDGLDADELLAQALETQGASQEALREMLSAAPSRRETDWSALVRAARLEAIDAWAPLVLQPVKRRLARELGIWTQALSTEQYVRWFASCLGRQIATWRRMRFLHDYHQPGISRWKPGHLYTLGENNVTLLAEFPDLDTGVFVDDEDAQIEAAIQLPAADVRILRDGFNTFHQRDRVAAETVVRTLALLLSRDDPGLATSALGDYRRSYADA